MYTERNYRVNSSRIYIKRKKNDQGHRPIISKQECNNRLIMDLVKNYAIISKHSNSIGSNGIQNASDIAVPSILIHFVKIKIPEG